MARSLTHPVFGALQWEAAFGWWFTQIRRASGDWLDVIVDPGEEEPSAFVRRAAQLYCRALDAERGILQEAIQKGLLDLYKQWRQADEPERTAAELKSHLVLTFVRIDTVTPLILNYGLEDVFGGHSVDVEVNEQLQVTGVHLVG